MQHTRHILIIQPPKYGPNKDIHFSLSGPLYIYIFLFMFKRREKKNKAGTVWAESVFLG
jgi:hypothetical protein